MGERYIEELVDQIENDRRYLLAHTAEDIAMLRVNQGLMPSPLHVSTGASMAGILDPEAVKSEHYRRFSPMRRSSSIKFPE